MSDESGANGSHVIAGADEISDPIRILVFGSIGNPQQLYQQIKAIQPQFHYIFVLDSPSDLVLQHPAPIPTYFLHTDSSQTDYPDLNLTLLPKYGVLELSNLTVAYVVDPDDSCHIPERQVDILLSRQFPRGFHQFWNQTVDSPWAIGNYAISKLAMALTPRYHFALGFHAEIPPFRNGAAITRFIGLAKHGNKDKQKFRYAFVLNKIVTEPKDLTACPYTAKSPSPDSQPRYGSERPAKKHKSSLQPVDNAGIQRWSMSQEDDGSNQPPEGYICRRCQQPGHFIQSCPLSRSKSATNQPCWFCLASPTLESHLIVTIGKELYLALPKGGMHPQHVLIIPIAHIASSLHLPNSARQELLQYKKDLSAAFQDNIVFYERYIRTRNATHLQIQAIPVSPEQMPSMTADTFIRVASDESHVQFRKVSDAFDVFSLSKESQFIWVELGHECVFYQHSEGKHVPLQIVRATLASMLGNPSLADWQQCRASVEQETTLRDTFKQLFAPFDASHPS